MPLLRFLTFNELPGSYALCKIWDWEDDAVQQANRCTLLTMSVGSDYLSAPIPAGRTFPTATAYPASSKKAMWPFNRQSEYRTILDKHIDGDFSLFACGKDAPRESVILQFEQEIGFSLPKEFRAFSMSPLGGVYIDVKEQVWPRAKEHAVGPFWSFLYGMFVFGFGKDIPDWMDIRVHTSKFQQSTDTRLVPFLKVLGDADVYCFDKRGTVCRWDHETGQAAVLPKTFREIFAHEVEQLRKRKDKKKAEPGTASVS